MSDFALIINQQGVKRTLTGPFEICISRDALSILKERLNEVPEDWIYGWITIYEKPVVVVTPNTAPLSWTGEGIPQPISL